MTIMMSDHPITDHGTATPPPHLRVIFCTISDAALQEPITYTKTGGYKLKGITNYGVILRKRLYIATASMFFLSFNNIPPRCH